MLTCCQCSRKGQTWVNIFCFAGFAIHICSVSGQNSMIVSVLYHCLFISIHRPKIWTITETAKSALTHLFFSLLMLVKQYFQYLRPFLQSALNIKNMNSVFSVLKSSSRVKNPIYMKMRVPPVKVNFEQQGKTASNIFKID